MKEGWKLGQLSTIKPVKLFPGEQHILIINWKTSGRGYIQKSSKWKEHKENLFSRFCIHVFYRDKSMQVRSSEIFIYYQQPPIQPDPSLIALSLLLIFTCKKLLKGSNLHQTLWASTSILKLHELMCMRSPENIL